MLAIARIHAAKASIKETVTHLRAQFHIQARQSALIVRQSNAYIIQITVARQSMLTSRAEALIPAVKRYVLHFVKNNIFPSKNAGLKPAFFVCVHVANGWRERNVCYLGQCH